jgi:hypothetical protein
MNGNNIISVKHDPWDGFLGCDFATLSALTANHLTRYTLLRALALISTYLI